MAKRFRRSQRLLSAADYKSVFSAPDLKAGQAEVLLLARHSAHSVSRLGLAVAKKHVPSAVQRNLIKRLARETFRNLSRRVDPASSEQHTGSSDDSAGSTAAAQIKPDRTVVLDVVVLSRPGARNASRETLRAALTRQFDRINHRATGKQTV